MPIVAAAAVAWFGRTVSVESQWPGALGLLDLGFDDPATAQHFGGSLVSDRNVQRQQPRFPPVVLPSDWSEALGGFTVGYRHNISFRDEIMTGTFFVVFRPQTALKCGHSTCAPVGPLLLTERPRVVDSSAFWRWTASLLDPVARERALNLDASYYNRKVNRDAAENVSVERVLAFTPPNVRSPAYDNFNTPSVFSRGIVNPH
jgi:hypothetical protein